MKEKKRRSMTGRIIEEGTLSDFKRSVLEYLVSSSAIGYRSFYNKNFGFSLRRDENLCKGKGYAYMLMGLHQSRNELRGRNRFTIET